MPHVTNAHGMPFKHGTTQIAPPKRGHQPLFIVESCAAACAMLRAATQSHIDTSLPMMKPSGSAEVVTHVGSEMSSSRIPSSTAAMSIGKSVRRSKLSAEPSCESHKSHSLREGAPQDGWLVALLHCVDTVLAKVWVLGWGRGGPASRWPGLGCIRSGSTCR
jgi:hypothetical protein